MAQTPIQIKAAAERAAMESGSTVFDLAVTPIIRPVLFGHQQHVRAAWWDGFLASVVGAMSATMGDDECERRCQDLFIRAKDWKSDQAKRGR
jgi:hypothetical protein